MLQLGVKTSSIRGMTNDSQNNEVCQFLAYSVEKIVLIHITDEGVPQVTDYLENHVNIVSVRRSLLVGSMQ